MAEFKPTQEQLQAKSKLHRTLRERDYALSLEDMSLAAIRDLAGVPESVFATWGRQDGFAPWLLDKDTLSHKIAAGAELAVNRMIEILQETDVGPRGRVKAGEVIKAAELLTKLADLLPQKQTVIRWADRELGAADQQAVDAELKMLDTKLGLIEEKSSEAT